MSVVDSLADALIQLERQPQSEILSLLSKPDSDLSALQSRLTDEVTQVTDELIFKYLPNPDDLVSMYTEAEKLDRSLASMERDLTTFLNGLHSVSESIHQLQYRSHEINTQLKDKRQVLDSLTTYVESVIIDPGLIRAIADVAQFSLATIPRLSELSSKLFALQRRQPPPDGDTSQTLILEKLRLRAVLKCKELLCGNFEDLKAARIDQLATVRAEISKLQPFLVFLHQHAEDAYDEVLAYYIPIASKVAAISVKNFLSKHPKPGISASVATFESLAAPPPLSHPHGSHPTTGGLSLSGREALIGEVKAAVKAGGEVPDRVLTSFEEHLFQYQLTIGNSACTEYAFLCAFFPAGHADIFTQVFQRTSGASQDEFTKDVNVCCDVVSLLLCVHSLEGVKEILSVRGVPSLRTYHERLLNVTLWPRIRSLYDQQIQSIKQANIKQLIGAGAALQPHFVARRYAELLSASLVLRKTSWGEATGFPACVRELVTAFDTMLGLLGKKTGNGNIQDESVFLLNNWDFINTVIVQNLNNVGISSTDSLVSKYEDKIKGATTGFVEGQLNLRFSQLLNFVADAETKAANADTAGLASIKESTVTTVNAWFRNNWKFEVEKIKTYVNTNFSNMNNGLEILKNILTQLLLYYTRFQKILAKKFGSTLPPNIAKDLVPTQDLMAEIKALTPF